MEETRAVARLPQLDVEITHRRLPEEDAEQLLIALRATPSFREFGAFAGSWAPLWAGLAAAPYMGYLRMMQAAWAPWLPAPTTAQEETPRGEVLMGPGRR
jgi:hypothetical protein